MRVFVADYGLAPQARDEVLGRLWYRLARAGIEIPFPQRVVHLRNPAAQRAPLARELLAKLDLFKPFEAEELQAVAEAAQLRSFGAGEEIVTEGGQGDTFFVVVSGRVSIRRGQPAREVAALGRGQSFGEMSLLTGEPRIATVTAIEDSTLLELGRESFATHFTAHPERAAQIAAVVAARRAELNAPEADPEAPVKDSARVLAKLREIFRLKG